MGGLVVGDLVAPSDRPLLLLLWRLLLAADLVSFASSLLGKDMGRGIRDRVNDVFLIPATPPPADARLLPLDE